MIELSAVRVSTHPNRNERFLGVAGCIDDQRGILQVSLCGVEQQRRRPSVTGSGRWVAVVGANADRVIVGAKPAGYHATYLPTADLLHRCTRAAEVASWVIGHVMEQGEVLAQAIDLVANPDGSQTVMGTTARSPFTVQAGSELFENVSLGEVGAGSMWMACRALLTAPDLIGFSINQGEFHPWDGNLIAPNAAG